MTWPTAKTTRKSNSNCCCRWLSITFAFLLVVNYVAAAAESIVEATSVASAVTTNVNILESTTQASNSPTPMTIRPTLIQAKQSKPLISAPTQQPQTLPHGDYELIDVAKQQTLSASNTDGDDAAGSTAQQSLAGQTTRYFTSGDVDDEFWLRHLGEDYKQAVHLLVGGSNYYGSSYNGSQDGDSDVNDFGAQTYYDDDAATPKANPVDDSITNEDDDNEAATKDDDEVNVSIKWWNGGNNDLQHGNISQDAKRVDRELKQQQEQNNETEPYERIFVLADNDSMKLSNMSYNPNSFYAPDEKAHKQKFNTHHYYTNAKPYKYRQNKHKNFYIKTQRTSEDANEDLPQQQPIVVHLPEDSQRAIYELKGNEEPVVVKMPPVIYHHSRVPAYGQQQQQQQHYRTQQHDLQHEQHNLEHEQHNIQHGQHNLQHEQHNLQHDSQHNLHHDPQHNIQYNTPHNIQYNTQHNLQHNSQYNPQHKTHLKTREELQYSVPPPTTQIYHSPTTLYQHQQQQQQQQQQQHSTTPQLSKTFYTSTNYNPLSSYQTLPSTTNNDNNDAQQVETAVQRLRYIIPKSTAQRRQRQLERFTIANYNPYERHRISRSFPGLVSPGDPAQLDANLAANSEPVYTRVSRSNREFSNKKHVNSKFSNQEYFDRKLFHAGL